MSQLVRVSVRVSVGNFVFKAMFRPMIRLKQPEVISGSGFHRLTQDSSGQDKFLLDRENILPFGLGSRLVKVTRQILAKNRHFMNPRSPNGADIEKSCGLYRLGPYLSYFVQSANMGLLVSNITLKI